MLTPFVITAYASGGTSGNETSAASTAGQAQIERNMRRAGINNTRQIRAAQRRAARVGGNVTSTRSIQ